MTDINFKKNYNNEFIKGMDIEFADMIAGTELTEKDFWKWDVLQFYKRSDEILNKLKEIGFTHIFYHFWFRQETDENGNYTNHFRLQNSEFGEKDKYEGNFTELFRKTKKLGLKPCIKLMIDHANNNDISTPKNPDNYFSEYSNITKQILSYDEDKIIDIITIANETALIRNYAKCRKYWEEYIAMLRKDYPYLTISTSHFFQDFNDGICNIADLIDIIGINYYPHVMLNKACPSIEEAMAFFYQNEIYGIQQYCKEHNKKFIITECGCSCWNYQMQEPELGNSMQNYYNTGINWKIPVNYAVAGFRSAINMDYCQGLNLMLGGNYCAVIINKSFTLYKDIEYNIYGLKKLSEILRGDINE